MKKPCLIFYIFNFFLLLIFSMGSGPACIGTETNDTTKEKLEEEIGTSTPEFCYVIFQYDYAKIVEFFSFEIICNGHEGVNTKKINNFDSQGNTQLAEQAATILQIMKELGFAEVMKFNFNASNKINEYAETYVFRRAENAEADPAVYAVVSKYPADYRVIPYNDMIIIHSDMNSSVDINDEDPNLLDIYIKTNDGCGESDWSVCLKLQDSNLLDNYMKTNGYSLVQEAPPGEFGVKNYLYRKDQ